MEDCYEHLSSLSQQDDRTETFNILKRLALERKGIKLLNYYRDVPVEHFGRVINVEREEAEIETSELQAKLINLQRKTILKSGMLGHHVLADVRHVDSERQRAVIGNPRYIRLHSDRRNAVRVQLKRPIAIMMEVEGNRISGSLKNISLGGCAVDTLVKDLLEQNQTASLNLKLPDSHTGEFSDIRLETRIIRVEGEHIPYRCALGFIHDRTTEGVVAGFLHQRQVEIIRELRDSI